MLRSAALTLTSVSSDRFAARWTTWVCAGAVVIGLALRTYWAFLIPFNDAPDEFCHFAMVRYLAEEGRPPTMADVRARVPVSYPALSPLGYVPPALGMWLAGTESPYSYLGARLVNVGLGTLLIIVLFQVTRELFPTAPCVAGLLAFLVALHPQLIFTSAYVNNDASMLLATGLVWWCWVGIGIRGSTPARWGMLGLIAGLAILMKMNSLGVILAGAPIVALSLRDAPRLSHGMRNLVMAAGSFVLVCLPWWVWNWIQHHSLFGTEIHREWWINDLKERGLGLGYLNAENFGAFLVSTWESFWGCFGYASTRLHAVDYYLITLMCGIAISRFLTRRPWNNAGEPADRSRNASVWVAMGFGVALVGAAHIYHSATFGMAAQGRYILPVSWPILLAIAVSFAPVGHGAIRASTRNYLWMSMPLMLMAWIAWSAIEQEKVSNRLPQPDRRVRARLVALEHDLPSRGRWTLPALDVHSTTRIERERSGTTFRSKEAIAVNLGELVDGGKAQWLMIEQRLLEGTPEGVLRVSDSRSGEVLDEIPYRDSCLGLARYRFDLRRTAEEYGDRRLRYTLITNKSGPAAVRLYRFDLLDANFQPLIGADLKEHRR